MQSGVNDDLLLRHMTSGHDRVCCLSSSAGLRRSALPKRPNDANLSFQSPIIWESRRNTSLKEATVSESTEAASIEPLPNGPYLVSGITNCRNSKGEAIRTESTMYLCRCGGSSMKPFCDGTHEKIGFSGERLSDPSTSKMDDYVGKELTIHDNRFICAHAGFCTRHSPNVFDVTREPWIDPDRDPAAKTIETVKLCPSGALSYTVNGTLYRDQVRAPFIQVTKNGPLFVVGGPELRGEARPPSPEHFALCRCGASKNKPFCDGSHFRVRFKDDGTSAVE
jgi:CDGSH-type Zn-finger protein/ferredoxin